MGVYIPNMSKPKRCIEEWGFGLMGNPCKFLETDMSCLLQPESEPFDCGENYESCPLIEIDQEAIDIAQDIMDGCRELKERINADIVRCEECKWCEKMEGVLWCNTWHDDTNGLNFCSYAERRADGDI